MARVLVTGGAGYVAGYILPAFRANGHELRLVDNRAAPGVEVHDLAGLERIEASRALFRGVDAVVHLAFLRPSDESAHARYLAERGNVDMAYLVYKLARE